MMDYSSDIELMGADFMEFMKEYAKRFRERVPLVESPMLNHDQPVVEQLVRCQCGAQFRMYVNSDDDGVYSIEAVRNSDIICGNCKLPIREGTVSISGHSGDFFNASVHWERGSMAESPIPPIQE